VREISCRYCKIYHYLVLCKAKGYMVESHTTHSSLRDVLKMSWVRSQGSPFDHVPIDYQPFTALEQWKGTGCCEWLWSIWTVKRDAPFSRRFSKNCVLWIYLNIIGYHKIIGFYDILRTFMIPYNIFLGYPGCYSLEYPWDRLYQSGTIWGILRIKCAVWVCIGLGKKFLRVFPVDRFRIA